MQRREPVHAPCVPHWQLPAAEHESARPDAVQSVHALPAWPQLVGESVVHTPARQQPPEHETASHAHAPPVHREPGGQAAPPPHVHAPSVQPSAPIPQDEHAPPAAPHALAVGETQLEPEQQPLAHVVALQLVQIPLAHVPLLHALHAAPPTPHALDAVPARHDVP
jgi:hypothetical protein